MEDCSHKEYISFYQTQKDTFKICSILDYAKHLCELINQDYEEFSRQNDQHKLSHGDIEKDGCLYRFSITDGYTIYIDTEDYKVKSFQISQEGIEQGLETIAE